MKVISTLLQSPHGFMTRQGGVSSGIYESLNCGIGSADDADHVTTNRQRVVAAVSDGPVQLLTPFQVHSPDAVIVTESNREDRPEADALVTQLPDLTIGIVTADCVPVLLEDTASGTVAAMHAGWKGTLAGIVKNTVNTMVKAGAKRESIGAAIGPAIAQSSYEVGPEVLEAFQRDDSAWADYFIPSGKAGHHLFNLPGVVAEQLKLAGIQQVDSLNLDTYTLKDRFFSYRRSTHRREVDYGRQLSAIMNGANST